MTNPSQYLLGIILIQEEFVSILFEMEVINIISQDQIMQNELHIQWET